MLVASPPAEGTRPGQLALPPRCDMSSIYTRNGRLAPVAGRLYSSRGGAGSVTQNGYHGQPNNALRGMPVPRHIVCLTFDFDTQSGFIARGLTTPTSLSRGEFGLTGARRILGLLKARGLRSTWFTPGF